MKILIIVPKYNLHSNKPFTYFMPLGILHVSSYLRSKGFDVHPLNLNHYDDDKLKETLCGNHYDVICTGGIFTQIKPILHVIEMSRKYHSQAKIVVGGGIASGDPEFAFEILKPDYLVLGEGELTMENLLCAIDRGQEQDICKVKGIAVINDGILLRTESQPVIHDLDALPYPDYDGFEYAHYLKHHVVIDNSFELIMDLNNRRVAHVSSSRDCALKCTFCFRIMGGEYRVRSIDSVIFQIKYLIDNYQINEVVLLDEMFSKDEERVFEFCEKIKPLNLIWNAQMRVNNITEKMLCQMKDAGCYLVSYGFESASKRVLKSMKKGITVEQISNAIEWTRKVKMTVQGNFIFGDPVETLETAEETFRFLRKYKNINISYGFILPFPGTVLYYNLKTKGAFKDLMNFYENSGSEDNLKNMTKLSKIDFRYLCRRVHQEQSINFASSHVIRSRHISKNLFDLVVECCNCKETVQFQLDIEKKRRMVCKYCYQRINVLKIDVKFSLSEFLNRIYRNHIAGIVISNPIVHKVFSYWILEGYRKIKSLQV